mgnify:CR=1 FL=1
MPDHSTDVAIIVGVDTHKDIHAAVDIDTLGRRQGQLAIPATAAGYQQLHRWALDVGPTKASVSKAQAPTAPASPATCTTAACTSSKSTVPTGPPGTGSASPTYRASHCSSAVRYYAPAS